MKTRFRRMRVLRTLVAGGLLLQLAGCDLGGFSQRYRIGFSEGLGNLSAQAAFNLLTSAAGGAGDITFCGGSVACPD